jgi:transcriptional regulator with XRE-family HTH domain
MKFEEMVMMPVAERLQEIRKSKGISQTQLSELSGVSNRHISDIELGRRTPSLDVLKKLADALNISVADFFMP